MGNLKHLRSGRVGRDGRKGCHGHAVREGSGISVPIGVIVVVPRARTKDTRSKISETASERRTSAVPAGVQPSRSTFPHPLAQEENEQRQREDSADNNGCDNSRVQSPAPRRVRSSSTTIDRAATISTCRVLPTGSISRVGSSGDFCSDTRDRGDNHIPLII